MTAQAIQQSQATHPPPPPPKTETTVQKLEDNAHVQQFEEIIEEKLRQERASRVQSEAELKKAQANIENLNQKTQALSSEVEALRQELADAQEDRIALRSSLHFQDEDRAHVVASFDLVNDAVDSWCCEISNRIIDSIPAEGDLTLEHIHDRSKFCLALPNGQDLDAQLRRIPSQSISLDTLLAYAFCSIVVHRLRCSVFAPFHPSFARPMTNQIAKSDLASRHEFLRNLTDEVRRSCRSWLYRA
jgi:vacuolar-type H+-ATPase subunit I/STV1